MAVMGMNVDVGLVSLMLFFFCQLLARQFGLAGEGITTALRQRRASFAAGCLPPLPPLGDPRKRDLNHHAWFETKKQKKRTQQISLLTSLARVRSSEDQPPNLLRGRCVMYTFPLCHCSFILHIWTTADVSHPLYRSPGARAVRPAPPPATAAGAWRASTSTIEIVLDSEPNLLGSLQPLQSFRRGWRQRQRGMAMPGGGGYGGYGGGPDDYYHQVGALGAVARCLRTRPHAPPLSNYLPSLCKRHTHLDYHLRVNPWCK